MARQTKISAFFAKKPNPPPPPLTLETEEVETFRTASQHTDKYQSQSIVHKVDDKDKEDGRAAATTKVEQEDSDTEMSSPSSQVQSPSLDAAPSSQLSGKAVALTRTATFDKFSLSPVTGANMPSFQRLLKTLLPVAYPIRFFNDILDAQSLLGRVAVWHGDNALHGAEEAIGGIKARLEDVEPEDAEPAQADVVEQQLYVQTLGVLAPYRGHGIAAQLLEAVVEEALALAEASRQSDDVGNVKIRVTSVYAHVWEANEDALGWYKRRGFTVEKLLGSYYRKLRPAGAYVVRKQLN